MAGNQNSLDEFLALVPVENFEDQYRGDITVDHYFNRPLERVLVAEKALLAKETKSVAYFSMEYGLSAHSYNAYTSKKAESPKNQHTIHRVFSNLRAMDQYNRINAKTRFDIPIYSGGLGVLAGDALKSAADLEIPLVGIGILWNKGYFKQNFWFASGQLPAQQNWDPWSYPGLIPLKTRISLPFKKETIHIRLWKYYIFSFEGNHVIPLILMDSNIPENSEFARTMTDSLYRSDNVDWKILQRAILGIGGMKALKQLGYSIDIFHLNEGHAAMAFAEAATSQGNPSIDALKEHFAYTCHTPVAAGHDRFHENNLRQILPDRLSNLIIQYGNDPEQSGMVNLTLLAMRTCKYINAVAQKHGEVTRLQFPQFKERIRAITNGVHSHTWVSQSVSSFLDRFKNEIGDWRKNQCQLKNVLNLKNNQAFRKGLWDAHQENKIYLSTLLKNWNCNPNVFTICWARRIAAYKRPSLILRNVNRLLDIAKKTGPIQIILAGKAHPQDGLGFTFINDILSAIDSLGQHRDLLRVMMLENYDTFFAKILTSGVDVWLNNPLPPFEASGTSGMKAIINGILQMSTLDGWAVEATHYDFGWIFGWQHQGNQIGDEHDLHLEGDSAQLYETLEKAVGLYYDANHNGIPNVDSEWISKMMNAICAAGFFNTGRMISEYDKYIWKTMLEKNLQC